jgi:hypothetical protein
MRTLTNNEYANLQKEYYNEVHQFDSIDVWFSPEYYAVSDSSSQGQIWY